MKIVHFKFDWNLFQAFNFIFIRLIPLNFLCILNTKKRFPAQFQGTIHKKWNGFLENSFWKITHFS